MSYRACNDSRMQPPLILIFILISGFGVRADDDDSLDSKKARDQQEMRDFLGAVYKGQGALNITSGTLAQGSEGAIVRTGNTFTTPRGVYVKCGNSWLLPDGRGAVVSTGKTFLSPDGAVVKTGTTYLGSEGNAVAAGQAVFRNYPKPKKEDDE